MATDGLIMTDINLNSLRNKPDERGRFGMHGGRFVAETLMPLRLQVESAYKAAQTDKEFAEELAYLLKKLENTPEPGQKGCMLEHTLVIWTNELGKGNSHTLNNIPFVLAGNGFGFRMGRTINCENDAHNRFLISLAHAVGHPLETFGNVALCKVGPLDLS